MFTPSFRRRSLVLLGLSLLVGCQSAQAPGADPTTPIGTTAAQLALGVYGRAELPTAAFGFAEVTVYRLDNDAVVGRGRTNSDGSYGLAIEPGLPEGLPLRVIASAEGKTLGAIGTARLVPRQLVRAVMQADERETNLNLASTLALAAFMKRMKAISLALVLPNTNRINFQALNKLLELYAKAKAAAGATIAQYRTVGGSGGGSGGGGRTIEAVITSTLGPTGSGTLEPAIAQLITEPGSPLAQFSTEVTKLTQEAITLASQESGTVIQIEGEQFGQVQLAAVTASPPPGAAPGGASSTPSTSPSTSPSSSAAPVSPPGTPGPTPTPKPAGGGGSGGASAPRTPIFVNAGLALHGMLPLAATMPEAKTVGFSGNWNLPTSDTSLPTQTFNLSIPDGAPTSDAPTGSSLSLSPAIGLPTRAASTETPVGLSVPVGQPAQASGSGTHLTVGGPLGVPVPRPTPTPTP